RESRCWRSRAPWAAPRRALHRDRRALRPAHRYGKCTQAPVSRSTICTPHQSSESVSASLRSRASSSKRSKGIFAIEGKPAHETWAEGELLELGLFGGSAFLDPADLSSSRVQHPLPR